jgi:acetyl esterase/lipase
MIRILSAVLAFAGLLSASDRAPYNIPLWEPGQTPFAAGTDPTDTPFLTVFLPPQGKGNGASLIVAPGGGNIMMMYGTEGFEIAERFNDWGGAAFVLTYRLAPKYGEDARVADGSRAVQLVRARAREWNLDPNRIGFAGFSAGSSLARSVAAAAKPDSRPDFLVLVYGPGRAAPGEQLKDFPPTFLLCAAADRGNAMLHWMRI